MRLVLLALPWASVGFAPGPALPRAAAPPRARARAPPPRMALGVLARKAKERQIAVLKEEVASAGAAHPLGERMALVASGGFDADAVDGVDSLLDALERPAGSLAVVCEYRRALPEARARANTFPLSRRGRFPLSDREAARARARALPRSRSSRAAAATSSRCRRRRSCRRRCATRARRA